MAQIQNKKNKGGITKHAKPDSLRPDKIRTHHGADAAGRSHEKIILFALFIYAVLLYANTIGNKYALDDLVVITDNHFTQQGIKGIPALLTTDLFEGIYGHNATALQGGRYRPLTLVTYAIEYQFFGLNPHVSHLINILLYGLLAVLLFRMLRMMIPAMPMVSLIATLLFIAHPVHAEVVANIKSRDEIFSLIGLVAMMLYLFKFLKKPESVRFLVYASISYFLSLLSKENGITFPVIIPMTLYFFTSLSAARIFRITLPFIIVFAGYYVLRTSLVGTADNMKALNLMDNPFAHSPLAEKLATIMSILGKYLLLLFFPHPLSCDYSYNQIPLTGWNSWRALLPFAIYLSMAVYAIVRFRKKDVMAYCILFCLLTLSLVSNIFFNIGAPMGERFLFLPSVGFCLAISFLFLKLLKAEERRQMKLSSPMIAIPLFVVLVLFSVKTFSRNFDWKDNLTLFAADVNHVPNSAKIHYYYGNELCIKATGVQDAIQKQKQFSVAKTETLRSLEINPEFVLSNYNLALIYQGEGNADSSIYYLRNILHLDPTYAPVYGSFGIVFGRMKGEYDSAIYYLKKAVFLNPGDAGSFENLGMAYAMKNDLDNAIPMLEQANALQPNNANTLMNLKAAYNNKGDKQKAQMYYERAVAINPSLKK